MKYLSVYSKYKQVVLVTFVVPLSNKTMYGQVLATKDIHMNTSTQCFPLARTVMSVVLMFWLIFFLFVLSNYNSSKSSLSLQPPKAHGYCINSCLTCQSD